MERVRIFRFLFGLRKVKEVYRVWREDVFIVEWKIDFIGNVEGIRERGEREDLRFY